MLTTSSIFLFITALALFVYWTLAFLVLYHLIRFGVSGQPKKIAAVFLAGSLVLSLMTLLFIAQVDTSQFNSFEGIHLFQFN